MSGASVKRLKSARTIAGLAYASLIEAVDEAASADPNPEAIELYESIAARNLRAALGELRASPVVLVPNKDRVA